MVEERVGGRDRRARDERARRARSRRGAPRAPAPTATIRRRCRAQACSSSRRTTRPIAAAPAKQRTGGRCRAARRAGGRRSATRPRGRRGEAVQALSAPSPAPDGRKHHRPSRATSPVARRAGGERRTKQGRRCAEDLAAYSSAPRRPTRAQRPGTPHGGSVAAAEGMITPWAKRCRECRATRSPPGQEPWILLAEPCEALTDEFDVTVVTGMVPGVTKQGRSELMRRGRARRPRSASIRQQFLAGVRSIHPLLPCSSAVERLDVFLVPECRPADDVCR